MNTNHDNEGAEHFARQIGNGKLARGATELKLVHRDEINLKSRAKRRSRRGRVM